jgi:hypothetical protein
MQPRAQRAADVQPACLASQHEKCCLERVLGVVLVPENHTAGTPDHPPVPLHQHLKRRLVAIESEPREQLLVRQPGDGAVSEQSLDLG